VEISWKTFKIPGGNRNHSVMVISRGYGNFQGAMEYSRGYTNDTDMVFSRGYGNFQGSMEKPRGPPYFTLDTVCMVLCTHVW